GFRVAADIAIHTGDVCCVGRDDVADAAVITPDADRDEADGKAVEHGDGFSEKDDVVVHCFRQVKPAVSHWKSGNPATEMRTNPPMIITPQSQSGSCRS